LYLNLRRCQWVAANDRHPMQQAGMNAWTFIVYNLQEHNRTLRMSIHHSFMYMILAVCKVIITVPELWVQDLSYVGF
jgi:hypothetical protein